MALSPVRGKLNIKNEVLFSRHCKMSSPQQICSLYLCLSIDMHVEKVITLVPLSNKEGLLLVLVVQELGRPQKNC